ncbi:MAG: hypothetical protein K2X81_07795, partial [Candidatus Obscuribacterales bacterium]|nr:hypothetical protein [Candidatus Obscuribacterales bacterium]
MTKIAIISQAEQGVLIDISGCSSLAEAKQYLMSTLQVSSHFWEGLIVDLNLGPLVLTPEQVNEIQAIVSEVGVQPRQIFSLSPITRSALIQCRLPLGPQQFPSSAQTKASENPFLKQESAGVQAENDLSALVQNAQEIESPVTAGGIATAIVELSNWSDESSAEKPVPVAAEAVATATQERPASA